MYKKYTHTQYTHTDNTDTHNTHTDKGQDMNELIPGTQGNLRTATGFSTDLFNNWIAYIDATPKTVQTYTRAVKQFVYYLQAEGISNPTRETIIAYKDSLAADHKATTINAYLMALKQFFKWTAQEGIYPNIAEHIKGAKLDKGFKKDYLTTKQTGKLLSTVDTTTLKGKRDYAILALMLCTGLRTIEVARANLEDLRTVADFTALYIQGKGHTERTDYVKVPAQVEDAIRAYLNARGKADDKAPLFTSIAHRNTGERMTTRSISRLVKDNLIEADLNSSRLTAHSLRHTAATIALLNGATPQETQQLLRHANINTTLIYSHALERAQNNSEDKIAGAIFG